jgi:predicted DsbA family dithiol-disulfide isomerase
VKIGLWTMMGCVLLTVAAVVCAQEAPVATGSDVVAMIGDEVITESELDDMVGSALVSLRQQMYQAKMGRLQSEIFQRLVAEKATAEGVTSGEYLKKHITDKMVEPDDGEIVKIMSQYRSQLDADDLKARQQVSEALTQRQQLELQEELRKTLFVEAGVRILLEPPRVAVAIGQGTPSRGPADAPIVLVEFTDYQCPYCVRIQPTITALMERYDGQIRHVFKNLPLPIHSQARLAGEAALCAQDQGKYWEFHDWLFANQRAMNRGTMVAEAGELGMDTELFEACIDQKTYAAAVSADAREAQSFGITGTPGFLINGRVLSGAQPIEALEVVINEELVLRGIVPPPKKKAAQPAEATDEVATE